MTTVELATLVVPPALLLVLIKVGIWRANRNGGVSITARYQSCRAA